MSLDELRGLLDAAPRLDAEHDPDDPDDPHTSLAWLLAMAERTVAARPTPVDPRLVAALERDLAARPAREEALGQLHVDAPSCLRRAALALRDGPVIAVGDDDGVTLALRRLGHHDVCAVDLDERLLAFLAARGIETHRADFLAGPVPEALRGRFRVAITDPFRDLDGGLGFLCFAAACLQPDGELLWVDDPLWNPEHAAVAEAMAGLGWRVAEVRHDVHAYPLSTDSFDPDRIVTELGVDRAWITRVIEATSAWSNVYRLVRR